MTIGTLPAVAVHRNHNAAYHLPHAASTGGSSSRNSSNHYENDRNNNNQQQHQYHSQHAQPTTTTAPPPRLPSMGSECWSETALSWWRRRSRQQLKTRSTAAIVEPKNPSAAARAFVQGHQTIAGVPFWKIAPSRRRKRKRGASMPNRHYHHNQQQQQQQQGYNSNYNLPVVELSGPVAKTSTLLTLAAQFVVQTRPSKFSSTKNVAATTAAASEHRDNRRHNSSSSSSSMDDTTFLPQVFLLDSDWQVTASEIHKLVRCKLLCDYDNMAAAAAAAAETTTSENEQNVAAAASNRNDVERLAADCEDCTQRIHLAYADDNNSAGWLPILESLSSHLDKNDLASSLSHQHQQQHDHRHQHPATLILWDGLGNTCASSMSDEATRTEIQRALLRLVNDYNVMLVYTSTQAWPRRKNDWDERVTHRIRLDHQASSAAAAAAAPESSATTVSYPFVAQTGTGEVIPFSITSAGVRT